jgi:hypothetical protein
MVSIYNAANIRECSFKECARDITNYLSRVRYKTTSSKPGIHLLFANFIVFANHANNVGNAHLPPLLDYLGNFRVGLKARVNVKGWYHLRVF